MNASSPKTYRRLAAAVALALLFTIPAAAPSFAQRLRFVPPPVWVKKPVTPYAGDCGPNPPPGYRYDLQGWRTGFNRDFYCYMLDED